MDFLVLCRKRRGSALVIFLGVLGGGGGVMDNLLQM